jgi:hypothetical protein
MIINCKEKYFIITRENFYFGLLTGCIVCFLCILYIYTNQSELFIVITAFGSFIIALLYSNIFFYTIQEKIKYSFWLCLLASITTGLGSFLQNNILNFSIVVVILMIFLSFSTLNIGSGLFTVILLASNLFIIGTGFPAKNELYAFYNSISFFLGSGIIYSLLIIFAFLNRKKIKFKEIYKFPDFQPFKFSIIIYAIQLIISVLLTYYIYKYLNIPEGYWMPMTSLLVLRKNHDESIKRMKQRLMGTILGSLFSIPIYFINNKYILSVFLIPILLFVVLSASKHYGAYVLFLTIMIFIILNIASGKGINILYYRNLETFFSILFVTIIIFVTKYIRYIIKCKKSYSLSNL